MFDYIIVGGGSAGCVLANRLSANPNTSVCLLEAGPNDTSLAISTPAYMFLLMSMKKLNWMNYTKPEKNLNNRELFWPRAKVLGGCSSSNAMIYTRGHKEDFNHWKALGNSGWGYQDILPYFKKAENQASFGENEFHGVTGPLNVTSLKNYTQMSDVFINGGQEVGYQHNCDFNGKEQEGIGHYQVTQKNGRRCNTSAAYIKPIKKRKNLTVLTNAHVSRLMLDGTRVTGVEYFKKAKGKAIILNANKEVILSAGANNSPQILMLSGIGPKKELEKHNIPLVRDLPGVGQNLQDHLDTNMVEKCKKAATLSVSWDQPITTFTDLFNFYVRGCGRLSSPGTEAGGFVKSSEQETRPDLQFHFTSAQLKNHGRDWSAFIGHHYSLHVCNLQPKSRGKITLNSSNYKDNVNINPNFLDHTDDMEKMVKGVKACLKILESDAFKPYRGKAKTEHANLKTDKDIREYIRNKSESIYHPVGTCKMGNDDMAVVDAQLRVHGVQGLRVVDASIMPTITRSNTNAPTIAIAEKAAEMILHSIDHHEKAKMTYIS